MYNPFFSLFCVFIIIQVAWHYKQIMRSQSLLQVQTRDRIKVAIIKKYGYTPYIIKDMGKYKPEFVKEQFEIFMMNINDM